MQLSWLRRLNRCSIALLTVALGLMTIVFQMPTMERCVSSARSIRVHTNATHGQRPNDLSPEDIESVRIFVFFVGYQRSGHSLVGSMLDAHPHAVVPHEFMLFERLVDRNDSAALFNRTKLYNELWKHSVADATQGWRSDLAYDKAARKGYTLAIGGTNWHGAFTRLKVIGDKSGGKAARVFHRKPADFREAYEKLRIAVGVPIRVLHVVRDPFDIIASDTLYAASPVAGQRLRNVSELHKLSDPKLLVARARHLLSSSAAVDAMIGACNMTVLELHMADLLLDPRAVLKRLCAFLEIDCFEDYVRACGAKVLPPPVLPVQELVGWPPEVKSYLLQELSKYPFFRRYLPQGDMREGV